MDEPVDEQPELYGLIAEAFIKKSMWDEACDTLGHLIAHEDVSFSY